jgi:hypothetical protein
LDGFSIPSIFPLSTWAYKEISVSIRVFGEVGCLFSVCHRNGIEMGIPIYRIHHILKVSTDRLKHTEINTEKSISSSNTLYDEFDLSFDGKKKRLIDQLISESIAQFTTGRGRKERKIAEDIPHDLLAEDGRRRLYGTPS